MTSYVDIKYTQILIIIMELTKELTPLRRDKAIGFLSMYLEKEYMEESIEYMQSLLKFVLQVWMEAECN